MLNRIKKSKEQKVVGFDLDGTVLEHSPFPSLGDPLEGIQEELTTLQKAGWKVIIWTCRDQEQYEIISEHLKAHGVPFDYINENPFEGPSSSPKIFCDAYVDDRGISCDGRIKGIAARVMAHRPWHKRKRKGPAFLDALVARQTEDPGDIDDWVDEWHEQEGTNECTLHQFLGMSWEEYGEWVKDPEAIYEIVLKRVGK